MSAARGTERTVRSADFPLPSPNENFSTRSYTTLVSSRLTTSACWTADRASSTMGARATLWACSWRTTAPTDSRTCHRSCSRCCTSRRLKRYRPLRSAITAVRRAPNGRRGTPSGRSARVRFPQAGQRRTLGGTRSPAPPAAAVPPPDAARPGPRGGLGFRERLLAMPAPLGHHGDEFIHLLNRQQAAVRPAVSRLAAALPTRGGAFGRAGAWGGSEDGGRGELADVWPRRA